MSPDEIVAIKERWAPSLALPPENSNQPGRDIQALLDEVERLQGEAYFGPCYYCGEACDPLAGNLGRWSVPYPPVRGKLHHSHYDCLSQQLTERDRRIVKLEKLADDLGRLAGAGGPTHDAVRLLTEHGLIK